MTATPRRASPPTRAARLGALVGASEWIWIAGIHDPSPAGPWGRHRPRRAHRGRVTLPACRRRRPHAWRDQRAISIPRATLPSAGAPAVGALLRDRRQASGAARLRRLCRWPRRVRAAVARAVPRGAFEAFLLGPSRGDRGRPHPASGDSRLREPHDDPPRRAARKRIMPSPVILWFRRVPAPGRQSGARRRRGRRPPGDPALCARRRVARDPASGRRATLVAAAQPDRAGA